MPKFSYLFAINFDIGYVILEDRRNVHVWELVFAEDDQETCFTAGTIADDDQFLSNGRHARRNSMPANYKNSECKTIFLVETRLKRL